MYLSEMLDVELLHRHIEDGYVRTQTDGVRTIFNYTEKCQFDRVWDHVTRSCRGLIVDEDSVVVARPFLKFFNYGEPEAPEVDVNDRVICFDKMDGSLAIGFPYGDGTYGVATRGSFASDQAIHGTKVLRERYGSFVPPEGVTPLFEIIYPDNRIVVDYGGMDDLVLLGGAEIETGRFVSPGDASVMFDWPGPVVGQMPYATLGEALAAPPRDNAEGMVVYFPDTGGRVKIKQEDYVRLHRIVTGLSARTVWRHMVDGGTLDGLVGPLPDEFHGWVVDVWSDIWWQVEGRHSEAVKAYETLVGSLPDGWTRKDFAMKAVEHRERAALFALLDGRDPWDQMLRDARPEGSVTPSGRQWSEDTA